MHRINVTAISMKLERMGKLPFYTSAENLKNKKSRGNAYCSARFVGLKSYEQSLHLSCWLSMDVYNAPEVRLTALQDL